MADDFLETIELARKEGKDSSTLWLRLHKDGAISIEGQDFGPIMECFFAGRVRDHDDDYEYTVGVPVEAVPKLAFELLKERFTGQLGAEVKLMEFCRHHSVPYKFWSWP